MRSILAPTVLTRRIQRQGPWRKLRDQLSLLDQASSGRYRWSVLARAAVRCMLTCSCIDIERLGNPGWNWNNFEKYIQRTEG